MTVTAAVALAAPEVAVIVAEPLATAVTVPEDETVATDAADVAHDTLAPLIVAPLWSLTVAVSVAVSPMAPRLRLVADSVIDVATGVGVVGVVGVVGAVGVDPPPSPPPQARRNSATVNRTIRIAMIPIGRFPNFQLDLLVFGTLDAS